MRLAKQLFVGVMVCVFVAWLLLRSSHDIATLLSNILGSVAAGLVLTLVAIFVVDRVQDRLQRLTHEPVDRRVLEKLKWFCHSCLYTISLAAGFSLEERRWADASTADGLRCEEIRFCKETVSPSIDWRVRRLEEAHALEFADKMPGIVNEAERLILLFGRRINPDMEACLLDIADSANHLRHAVYATRVLLASTREKGILAVGETLSVRAQALLDATLDLADVLWADTLPGNIPRARPTSRST